MENHLKILLVDDADFFLEIEKAFLKYTPATIYTACNGAEALDMAVQYQPDLIYMDVQMPVMDGLSCLQALKSNPVLKKVPVIMVFTPTHEVTREVVEASPCDGVITKPIDKKEFLERGHQFLFHIDRRERRASCQMTVDFEMDGCSFQGVGIDISPGGLYIQFRGELPDLQVCRLSFMLPTVCPETIVTRGIVRWVNKGFPRSNLGMPQGFGVQFVDLGNRFQAAVTRYVELNS